MLKKWKHKDYNISSYVVLTLWSLIIIGIFAWVIISSFKSNLEIYTKPWSLPSKGTWDNYISAWKTMKMGDYFLNSIIVVFGAIFLSLIISTTTAHVLSRYAFKGRKLLTFLMITTMSIPVQMLLIPLYDQMLALRLVNTRHGLIIVYAALWLPFSLFVLIGFFKTVPIELEESAIIDGCGEFRIFYQIMIPMVQPGIICVAVFNFVAMWNEYLMALVFANKQSLRTIALGMYALKDSMMYTSNWGGLFAAIVIMMIPSIVIFVTLQKYVIQGLTIGAIKG